MINFYTKSFRLRVLAFAIFFTLTWSLFGAHIAVAADWTQIDDGFENGYWLTIRSSGDGTRLVGILYDSAEGSYSIQYSSNTGSSWSDKHHARRTPFGLVRQDPQEPPRVKSEPEAIATGFRQQLISDWL